MRDRQTSGTDGGAKTKFNATEAIIENFCRPDCRSRRAKGASNRLSFPVRPIRVARWEQAVAGELDASLWLNHD